MNKILRLGEPATSIYNLEVAFDPKSAFNYHCSYIREKTILLFPEHSKDMTTTISWVQLF